MYLLTLFSKSLFHSYLHMTNVKKLKLAVKFLNHLNCDPNVLTRQKNLFD